jgi:selenocysteine lyase/cysteine desulfurase
MTTLTLHISRSLAHLWGPDDESVVTRLDHDANATPWVLAAQDRGCKVRWVDFCLEDGTLDMDLLATALESHPRLLAVGFASNALGTINPIEEIVRLAHEAGTLVYVDAVHYAPHGRSTSSAWVVTFWSAPPISSSVRTSGYCTVNTTCSTS